MPEVIQNRSTRRLLCEGWLDVEVENADAVRESLIFEPSIAYVRQGNKVCFFKGKSKELCESFDATTTIVESIENLELIHECDGTPIVKDGEWVVEGVFQRSGVKNANGRTYSRKLWERVLAENDFAQKAIRERGMIGHLEHPKDGRTDGNLGAILVLEAKLLEDGSVYGKAKVLDTIPGRTIKTYIREGVRWGFSSRGSGTIRTDGAVDENDYRLECWDAVMRPSTPGGYAVVPQEGIDKVSINPVDEADTTMHLHKPHGDYTINKLGPEFKLTHDEGKRHALAYRPKGGSTWHDLGRHESDAAATMAASNHSKKIKESDEALESVEVFAKEVDQMIHESRFEPKLIGRFIEQFRQVSDGAGEATTSPAKLATAMRSLSYAAQKLLPLATTPIQEAVTATLDEVAEAESQKEIRRAAFIRITEKYEERIKALTEKCAAATSQLDAERGKQINESSRSVQFEQERDEFRQQVAVLESDLADCRSQLETARHYLAETTQVEIVDPIREKVQAIIAEQPQWAQFEDVLCEAKTTDRVDYLMERLGSVAHPQPEVPQLPNDRVTSPPRGGVVESERTVRTKTTSKAHPNVRLAGQVMSRMAIVKPK